jgi:hypothetical protein
MTSSRKQKLSPQFSPQSFPKMAKKFSVTIRNNCVWHAMQANNFPKEQISDMRSIISFMMWYEVSHFRESIHNYKNAITSSFSPVNPTQNK